ncbi:MAG TPA: hypothetical protein VES69_01490 [Pyrinomonadaceae bacterium]|nr:hypothetical protein [Pyrinomonadaceae bacterium]
MLRGLFRTKDLDDILASIGGPQFSLKRTLSAFNVTLIGVGAIIGAEYLLRWAPPLPAIRLALITIVLAWGIKEIRQRGMQPLARIKLRLIADMETV